MDSDKQINDENIGPSPSKRLKQSSNSKLTNRTSKILKILNEKEKPVDLLRHMGLGILETSEESSNSATEINQAPQNNPAVDNKNFHTNQSTSSTKKPTNSRKIMDTKISENLNFINPNVSKTSAHRASVGSIEIYNDETPSSINKTAERQLHKTDRNGTSKVRSPLTIVPCNNTVNMKVEQNNQKTTEVTPQQSQLALTFDASLALKKHLGQVVVYPDNAEEEFFLFRRKSENYTLGQDCFRQLSDEMILQIFYWLPKKTLLRCAHVCRRFSQLAQDESLWTRLDLGCRTLRKGALGKIVSRGVVILRLAQTEIAHPAFEPNSPELSSDFVSKLQYLDLSMAVISPESLKILFSKCRNLRKLSLEHVPLDKEICQEISENKNLEALNLAMCLFTKNETWSIHQLMAELKNLQTLNISWTGLSLDSVKVLVKTVTSTMSRLNIAGCRKTIYDAEVTTLVNRCPNLIELDLSDCAALTSISIAQISKLKNLEYLSLSRCYSISAGSFMDLNNSDSLEYLDVFGFLSDAALQLLQNTFPKFKINKFIHSSVARPTVGTRRTSIWGLRTRD